MPQAENRGQAAIEYIMTYGWAILALVIIIAMLAGSGILSPSFMVSEECTLGSNLPCRFAIFNQGGETNLALGLDNGFPYKIKIISVQVVDPAHGGEFQGFAENAEVESGANYTAQAKLSGAEVTPNTVLHLYANVTYVACTPEVAVTGSDCSNSEHTISGTITGRVTTE